LDTDRSEFSCCSLGEEILPLSKKTWKGGKVMKKLLVLILLVASVAVIGCATTNQPANPTTSGRNWELLGKTGPDGSTEVFYDPDKTTVSNGIIRTEGRSVSEKEGLDGVYQLEIDCSRNQSRWANEVIYDKLNRVVSRTQGWSRWEPLPQNSSPIVDVAHKYCP